MPGCSVAKNPSGIEITFNEDNHRYFSIINGKEVIYTSATTFIGSFFKPFDVDKIAPFSAKKLGITVEEVKEKWKQTGIEAARFGTRCHEICEDTILGRPLRNIPENEKEKSVFNLAINASRALKEKFEIVGVEKIVFDHRLKIAGTIDLFCKSKIQSNLYYIFDWKTNKDIVSENRYSEYAYDPIPYVDDTTLNHYKLQLNLYEYLLKFGNYIPRNSIVKKMLFHLKCDCIEKISIEDMQSEIKDLIIFKLLGEL